MSKIRNSWLLATASSVALSGAAQAKSAPPTPPATPAATPWWTGFYAGLDLGGARHYASTTDVNNYSGVPPGGNYVSPWFNSRKTSFTFGGQFGYNYQINYYVVGVEADISQIGASKTFAPPLGGIAAFIPAAATATNELAWLATFRGRAGFVYQQFLLYGTAGLAVGRVSNSWGFGSPGSVSSDFSVNATRTGFVYGGGLEYAASGHWVARIEGLFVDLGTTSQTINVPNPLSGGAPPFRTDFKNTATIGRLALSYKW